MLFSTIFVLGSATIAYAVDHTVLVGDNNALTFTPPSLTVASGDNILFEFKSKNHSVTQSTFAKPCERQTTPQPGSDSGFMAVAAGSAQTPTWNITIDDTSAPLWFYCAQRQPVDHCKAGMVFAINPTAEKTFEAFQSAAKASTSTDSSTPGSSGLPPTGTVSGSTETSTGTSTDASNAPQQTNGAFRAGPGAGGLLAFTGLLLGLMA